MPLWQDFENINDFYDGAQDESPSETLHRRISQDEQPDEDETLILIDPDEHLTD